MMINDEKCKAIDTFERLMSSEDKKVKDICRKALWTMRKGLVNSKRYVSLGKYRNIKFCSLIAWLLFSYIHYDWKFINSI